MSALLIPISVFAMIVLVVTVICSTFIIALKIIRGGASPKSQKDHASEAKMIQEIYQGLSRMEERVESLETILMEKEKLRKEQKNER